jgi:hypothetical protein
VAKRVHIEKKREGEREEVIIEERERERESLRDQHQTPIVIDVSPPKKRTHSPHTHSVVYHESIKRDLKRRLTYEYRYDERLKTKNEESTVLGETGLVVHTVSQDGMMYRVKTFF